MHRFLAAAAATLLALSPVLAEACGPRVELEFYESDGGDVFKIHNKSQKPWSVASVVLSLVATRGRVVFDTADGGAGTSMYYPFHPGAGDVGFVGATPVGDGDRALALKFSDFGPGKTFTFTVDVDAKSESGIDLPMVSDADMEGATGEAEMVKGADKLRATGTFGRQGKAVIGEGGLCA
jgi:hypothetical protein